MGIVGRGWCGDVYSKTSRAAHIVLWPPKLVTCTTQVHWQYLGIVNHTHLPTRGLRGLVESRKDQRRLNKYSLALSCSVMVNTSEVSSSHAMWGYLWGGERGVMCGVERGVMCGGVRGEGGHVCGGG